MATDTPEHELVEDIVVRLRAAANFARAESEAAYLKSDRPFIGVDVPTTRKIIKTVICSRPTPAPPNAIAAALALWQMPEFDTRRASVEVLCALAKRDELDTASLAWLEPMIAEGETWAIVDTLSVGVTGVIIDRDRSGEPVAVLRRWVKSDDMWVRRAAVLSLLPSLRRDLDRWPLFVEFADDLLAEKEFFIRKVIGWVARDVGRRHPERVVEWAAPRLDVMSAVTRREVTRHLSVLER